MRRFVFVTLLAVFVAPLLVCADDVPKDSAAAAKTRQKLQKKVTVNFKDTMLKEIVDELKDQTGGDQDGVKFQIDTKSGVSQNAKFTYKAKDKPAADVLTDILQMRKWGWYIISKEKDAYDGLVRVRVSEEKGYEQGSSK